MDNRENARRTIRFDHPQRVIGGPPCHWFGYFGVNHEGFDGHDQLPVGSRWTDIWGTLWHKEQEGVMGFPEVFPLADPAALRTYKWPDPDDERLIRLAYDQAGRFPGGDLFRGGSHRCTLWEKLYQTVGMANVMEYFYTEPAFVRELLQRIMDFDLGIARHYLKLGIEVAGLGDDLGTQCGPLMSPDLVREFLMPQYRRLFSLYKQHGVILSFHSCGRIDWMLPMFIELGIDVLNPVQATANDLDQVRALTQGKLALQGSISSGLVVSGPVERIRAEVKKRLWQLGRDGGYFCCPDQGMPWPKEHHAAYQRALEEFGRYPLTPPDPEQDRP